jgi:hypothetical protein
VEETLVINSEEMQMRRSKIQKTKLRSPVGGTLVLCGFFLVLLEPACVFAQRGKSRSQQTTRGFQSTSKGPAYTAAPVDLAVTSLPPSYSGHDVAALYNRLKALTGPKGEYETTEQFNARVQAAIIDDLYAFKVESPGLFESSFSYDADARALEVKVPISLANGLGDTGKPAGEKYVSFFAQTIPIKEESSTTHEYIGANAYGARVRVTERRIEDFQVIIGEEYHGGLSGSRSVGFTDYSMSFNIDMSPESAQVKKPALSLLLICRLKLFSGFPQVVYNAFSSTKPTISNPTSVVQSSKCINVDLSEIWVYDNVTGEILKKHKVIRK